jgi:hypothetical protein
MKNVSLEEFSGKVALYITRQEAVSVEQDGKTVGYYLPVKHVSEQESGAAMQALEQAVERVLAETRMSEDELVQCLTEGWNT